ncbi:MAG: type III-B CRISPR-associated protein Cas10/Cmr2 [Candidatus Viridilinea halotolerans]|uniref:Type III-B CRISPR-associated protein Cas10/Cmr2 n=1 Tax=Candidatus Viridilinea halotolerans TaxID=2491704 RepID=A0A426TY89_9CHLR|nr:MAG: type III-B CRISPR-associated protein Cas10/Cmr2 [Candidatus Viridilinea halotolerans]
MATPSPKTPPVRHTTMQTYLFLVTLGPIQDFIAAARRTRDLWAGSQLLSDLSRVAAQFLRDQGATLIFPAQAALQQHEVANRILVETTIAPQVLGPQVEDAIRCALRDHAERTFAAVRGLREEGMLPVALQQVDELLEIFWAGVARSDTYQADREHLEAALAARKNTRSFGQPAYQASVPKSSLDGMRESLIPEALFPARHDSEAERTVKRQRLFDRFGAGQAERLSGVDLLKRHSHYKAELGDFPSTSHFAALPLLTRQHMHGEAIPQAITRYVADLARLGVKVERLAKRFATASPLGAYDASILFEERLIEDIAPSEHAEARGYLADFLEATTNRRCPEPYYAILHADGDNMGKVIDHQAGAGMATHQSFSRDLDRFADGVRAIVEDGAHRGALVYAGGDDVLAFLPLDTVLACATVLAESFAAKLAAYKGAQHEDATLSVGIALGHHLEPLADLLNLARAAEKEAKRQPGKHALAIALSKRSGGTTTIVGGWQGGFLQRLTRFIELHRHDAFPDGAAYELRSLDERVGRALPAEALCAEALRILQRKRGKHGEAEVSDADRVLMEQALANGAAERRSAGRPAWGIHELADELIVAREFARAQGAT